MGYRVERVNELIKEEISSVIEFKLQDPRVGNAIVTVTRAKVTPDMKYAKVYVSIMGEDKDKEEALEGLRSAKGFLRREIAKVLNTRYTPELIFELDDSLDYAMHIEEVLSEIKADKKKDEEDE